MNLVDKAAGFAALHHDGQVRKYTGEVYIVHPAAVVDRLTAAGVNRPEVIAAAWLHDVVEDCGVTWQHLRGEFPNEVCELVWWLTSDESDLNKQNNRETRKWQDHIRLASSPTAALTIKCADLLDNGVSIREHDPSFWVQYRVEISLLLRRVAMRRDLDLYPLKGLHKQLMLEVGID